MVLFLNPSDGRLSFIVLFSGFLIVFCTLFAGSTEAASKDKPKESTSKDAPEITEDSTEEATDDAPETEEDSTESGDDSAAAEETPEEEETADDSDAKSEDMVAEEACEDVTTEADPCETSTYLEEKILKVEKRIQRRLKKIEEALEEA